jgi:hypothetical protein
MMVLTAHEAISQEEPEAATAPPDASSQGAA